MGESGAGTSGPRGRPADGHARAVGVATIRGVAAGGLGERTTTLPITVAAPSAGAIRWEFCDNAVRYPHFFFAVKDGAGPWRRVVPDGRAYSFDILGSTGAVAMVTGEGGGYRTSIYHFTPSEMAAAAAAECILYPCGTTRTALGTVTGLGSGEHSVMGMGWWFTSTTNVPGGTLTSYSLSNLPAGPLDLFAARVSLNAAPEVLTDR